MKNNKGFSLVELIVVIAIMAILAAVAIPTFATFIDKANVASDVSFVNDAEYAAELANAINGTEIDAVYVSVGTDKQPATVNVVFGEVIISVDETGAVKKNGAADTNNDWAKDIADALDWDYTFKKYTTAEDYKVSADGKTLVDATPAASGT